MMHSESLTLLEISVQISCCILVADLFSLTSKCQKYCVWAYIQTRHRLSMSDILTVFFRFVLSVMCNFSCVGAVMCVFNACEV